MDDQDKYIGYFKYDGKSVEDGLLDAKSSGEALLGLDEVLRYFVKKEDPSLSDFDFQIPVRIKKGSWEALIAHVVDKLFSEQGKIAFGIVATAYGTSVANAAGKDGFLQSGPAKDIVATFRAALKATQWIVKIASHLKGFVKSPLNTKINNQNPKEPIIQITNDEGKTLNVPKKYFDTYMDCPKKIFSKNAFIVEKERLLEIGLYDEEGNLHKVRITENERSIFYSDEDDEVLFPELKHNQQVQLVGAITKGNEKTNTIGFEYLGHILTSKPKTGSIADYKSKIVSQEDGHIFPKVKIVGIVDREDEFGKFKEKRPRIIFSDIIPIVIEKRQEKLFEN